MKAIFCILWIMGMLFISCSEREVVPDTEGSDSPETGKNEKFVFGIVGDGAIDSAQIFFFRNRLTKDTLIHRQVIYNISEKPVLFTFELPAGYYRVQIYGNVATDRIIASPPYSQENILFDYSDGEEHPMIYGGRMNINVGKDTSTISSLIEITSFVLLTIKDVPEGVDQIDVDLLNTGAGFYATDVMWKKLTEPNLIQSVYDVKANQTYIVTFACFPTIEALGMSSLDVRCYDKEGVLVYRGKSAPFSAISRNYITCSFGTANARTISGEDKYKNNVIHWEYDKRDN